MELWKLPAHRLRALLAAGEITARELAGALFDRIREVEPVLQSFLTLTGEKALQQAGEIDQRREAGEVLPPAAGIPIALKDNICVRDVPMTCASQMLANYTAVYNATAYRRLADAGAVLMGKTNLDEFGMGSSTENSAYHISKNPWDQGRVPGGSSGGSAAAVAGGETAWALGSDTGGSVRQPAAFCGIVGLKPTYGRVSRYGLAGYAPSLDQIGTMTRDVTDAALLFRIISGHDPLDSMSSRERVPDYTQSLVAEVAGLKIGVPREYFRGASTPVGDAVWEGIRLLEGMGAKVEETSLLPTNYCLQAYYILATAEASSNLACIDGVRYGYRAGADNLQDMYLQSRGRMGPEVRRRLILGTFILTGDNYDRYYLKAQRVRTLVKDDFARAFAQYDLLITPTSPTTAFALGARATQAQYPPDDYTVAANLAGLPALSLPCGFSRGLPVGMQLMGRPFAEEILFRVAYSYEQATEYHKAFPDVAAANQRGVK